MKNPPSGLPSAVEIVRDAAGQVVGRYRHDPGPSWAHGGRFTTVTPVVWEARDAGRWGRPIPAALKRRDLVEYPAQLGTHAASVRRATWRLEITLLHRHARNINLILAGRGHPGRIPEVLGAWEETTTTGRTFGVTVLTRLDGTPWRNLVGPYRPTPDGHAGLKSIGDAVELGVSAAELLAVCHLVGLVHGDVSEGNLFAARLPNGRWYANLADFDGAQDIEDPVAVTWVATTGDPPTVLLTDGRPSPESDLDMLAQRIVMLLVGKHPGGGAVSGLTTAPVLDVGVPEWVGSLRPEVPTPLISLLCLAEGSKALSRRTENERPPGVRNLTAFARHLRILHQPDGESAGRWLARLWHDLGHVEPSLVETACAWIIGEETMRPGARPEQDPTAWVIAIALRYGPLRDKIPTTPLQAIAASCLLAWARASDVTTLRNAGAEATRLVPEIDVSLLAEITDHALSLAAMSYESADRMAGESLEIAFGTATSWARRTVARLQRRLDQVVLVPLPAAMPGCYVLDVVDDAERPRTSVTFRLLGEGITGAVVGVPPWRLITHGAERMDIDHAEKALRAEGESLLAEFVRKSWNER